MDNLFVTSMSREIERRRLELNMIHNADLALEAREEIRRLESHLVNLPRTFGIEELNRQAGPEMIRFLVNLDPNEIFPT